jgi:hypothetical protein
VAVTWGHTERDAFDAICRATARFLEEVQNPPEPEEVPAKEERTSDLVDSMGL